MRDAARELPHRLHLLTLTQSILDPLALGDFLHKALVGLAQLPQMLLLLREIGEHATKQCHTVLAAQQAQRHVNRHPHAAHGEERQLAAGHAGLGLFEQPIKSAPVLFEDQWPQALSNDPLLRDAEHRSETAVAVQDRTIDAERDGSFLDLLDQHAVWAIGALQRVDPVLLGRPTHHQRVNLAAPDGAKRLLTLLQARFQFEDALDQRRFVGALWISCCHRVGAAAVSDPGLGGPAQFQKGRR